MSHCNRNQSLSEIVIDIQVYDDVGRYKCLDPIATFINGYVALQC